MKRHLYFVLLIGFMLLGIQGFGQTIQVGANFNAGNYGKGSSITVPITITGVFNQNEKFEIWLSDASGNFTSAIKIGEYQGFFSTFINGIIPTNTPDGSSYKIQVRASTSGANIANTATFSVSGNQAVLAKITPSNSLTVLKTDEIFGRCLPNVNGVIFTPQSSPNSAITSVITKNEITNQVFIGNLINELAKSYFTVTVTATLDGIIGTRSYSIINTDNSNPLQSTYTSPVCVNPDDPNSGGITFRVNIDSGADVYKNYPGTKYVINWSDGTIQTLTLAEIIELGGIITHRYTISSCNQSVQSNGVVYNNSFGIQSKAIHPYCAEGAPTINIARVFEMPRVAIESPPTACKSSTVTFVNKSTQGTYGDQNQPTCTGSNIFYDWYVDGELKLSNVNINTNFTYTFNTSGVHTVTLVPVDPSSTLPCIPNMVSNAICIEEVPVPAFQFDISGTLANTVKGCTPQVIKIKNQSNTLNGCSSPIYQWTLINTTTNVSGFYENNAIFAAGTNENSPEPQFTISNPGIYTLTLRVSNSCSPSGITTNRNFTVVGPPSVSALNYTAAYCEPVPKTITFNTHTYNPNSAPAQDLNYSWTITGGDFEFTSGTSAASAFPVIIFKSYATYTVKIDYDNGCGSVPKTQTITFNQPLVATITANTSSTDISECTGAVINLAGTISGPSGYTYQWTKSDNASGTLTPGPINAGSPTATYTPVAADDDKQLTFNLVITYPSPVPATCAASLTKPIKVTYTATNTAPNTNLNLCSGLAVNFTPTSTITNSAFIWSVISAGANITGQLDNLTYSRNPINDILVNNGNTPQQVIYQITPRSASGCAGTAFQLIVTVYPELTGNVISDNQTICVNQTPTVLGQSVSQNLIGGGGNGTYVYLWEQSIDNTNWLAALGTSNQATYQAPALSVDTYYRRKVFSPDTSTCSILSNAIKITVNPVPDISLAAINEICSTLNSFTIPFTNTEEDPTHFDLSVGTRIMPGFTNLANVSFTNTNSPIQITIPANVPAGTYDFNLKVRNANNCESSVKSFTLVVKAPPTPASAGTDQTLCNTGTFILGGNTPSAGTGIWTINGAANGAIINNPNLPGATVSGLQQGKSVTLIWTISNGTCTNSTDEVVLTNVIPTPSANAGANQYLCNTATQTALNANLPGGTFVGTWTDVTSGGPGGLIFSPNANTPGATVSGLVAGIEYKLRWTIAGNAPCGDNTSEVIIAVRPLVTAANAGTDAPLCDQTTSNNFFNLNANQDNSRAYETGTWSIITQPINSNATFSNLNNPAATLQNLIPGTYRLQWLISNDAGCVSAPDEVIVQVYAKPVGGSLTSSITEVCLGTMSGTLNLASHTGAIEQWESATNLSGPWTAIANTTTTYTFPNLSQTTYIRVKVVSHGLALGCNSSLPAYSNILTITVNPTTVGGNTTVAGNATVCQGTNSGSINLSAQVGSVTSWEYSINGGANWLAISNTANQTTYNFSGLSQTTQFRAVVKSGACLIEASSATTITVLALTQAAVSNLEVCTASTVQIRGNASVGTEIGTWAQISGPNLVTIANINDPQTTVSGLLVGTYQFNWTIDNGVCAPSVATLTLNNYPALDNEIQTSLSTICAGQAADLRDKAHTGGTGAYTYQWQSSTDNVTWTTLSGEVSKDLSLLLNISTYFKRILVSGPCSSESNVIFITVQPPISNNDITQNQEVCIQKPVAQLNGSLPQGGDGNYTYTWQQSLNGTSWTTISGAIQPDFQPPLLNQTTWYRRLVSTALCSGEQQSISNQIEITVRPNAKAEFSASKTLACVPFNLAGAIIVVPHSDLNASYEWFANNVSIGTGSVFPGYVINTDGEQVIIKLVTISKYGCDTDEKSITFETVKSVSASFTLDKTVGCGSLSVTFTNTSVPLNGASYAWNFGNGQTSASANPNSITFQPHPLNRDTIYTVQLRAYTDCQESVYTANVLVRPQPISVFTPDKTEGCSPFLVNFSNQSKGEPATYEFDFGDGSPIYTTNSLEEAAHTFTVLSNTIFTVKLKVTNECGTSSSSYNIRVRPNTVTANLVVNGPQLIGCQPHTVTFYNNSVGANQYTWDFGDGTPLITNAALIMTHTYTISGTFTAKLTATNGCSTTSTTEQILVHPQPIASFTTTKNNYCKDEWIYFINTSPQGDFVWDFGDGVISTQQNPQHRFVTPGVYTVTLITSVTQADGMKCSTTVTKQITVLTPPIATFATNASAFNCAPFHLIVSNNSQFANKYSWFMDGILVSTERNPTNLWLYGSNTGVNVRLVVENTLGCTAVAAEKVEQLYPRPVADFVVLPSAIIKIPNYTFNFQNNTSGAVTTYKWTFGDGTSSTEVSPTHTYKMIGQYQVNLISFNQEGCSDTITRQVEIQTVPGYLFVPNAFEPGSQTYELKTFKPKGSGIESYRMQIFNKWGMLVWETTIIDSDGSPVEGWDGLMNGVPAPPDVYVWTIDAKFINQTVWPGMRYKSSDKPKTTGSIHLIR
jgi:PKD repeat protein